jgi:uncharacterized protein (DUF169 family)
MLIAEAAHAAGFFEASTAMGRPTCAIVPYASASVTGVASIGCIGNRVYAALGDHELYFAVPGSGLGRTLEQLDAILVANDALEGFHRDRAAALSA